MTFVELLGYVLTNATQFRYKWNMHHHFCARFIRREDLNRQNHAGVRRIRFKGSILKNGTDTWKSHGADRSEMRYLELTRAPCNRTLKVMAVNGDANWEKRFEAMGIRKGRRIRKIADQPFGGPVVIEVDSSKISLGRNIASKIEVEVLAPPF